MAEQLNPRTKRAREALTQAAFDLVAQRPVADISLTEIAEAAQVSRPTVYKQFNDTASLVAATTIEFMETTFARIDDEVRHIDKSTVDYLEQLMLSFIRSVYARRDFCKNAMQGPSCVEISSYVVSMLDERMAAGLVGKRLSSHEAAADDCRAAISAGVMWLLVKWLNSDFAGENSPESIAHRITSVIVSFSNATEA